MVSHQVAAAFFAILPLANLSLLKHADVIGPKVIRTASGFQRLKAFTGPPDHERQDAQWQ
jgi:hypothetical protein